MIKNKILLDDKGSIVQPSDTTRISSRGRENEGQPPEYGSIRQICLWLESKSTSVKELDTTMKSKGGYHTQ